MGIMYEINDEVIDQIQEMAGRIRQDIVKMLGEAGSGHTGGSLSAADIVACLYFWELRVIRTSALAGTGSFVLSKGHAAPLLYALWQKRVSFPGKSWWLRRYGKPCRDIRI